MLTYTQQLTPKIAGSFRSVLTWSGSGAQHAHADRLREFLHTLRHTDIDTYIELVARVLEVPPEDACLGIRVVTQTALFAACLHLHVCAACCYWIATTMTTPLSPKHSEHCPAFVPAILSRLDKHSACCPSYCLLQHQSKMQPVDLAAAAA